MEDESLPCAQRRKPCITARLAKALEINFLNVYLITLLSSALIPSL